MKKYYALMITVLAFVTGTTGCNVGETDYGVIVPTVDEDQQFYDDETEPDVIQTDTDTADIDISDIDETDIDSGTDDNDLIEPDEDVPASKYGVQYTEYDSN